MHHPSAPLWRVCSSEYDRGIFWKMPGYPPCFRSACCQIQELVSGKGYGVVVKTTGRTVRETERIAEIIEEEYGYL